LVTKIIESFIFPFKSQRHLSFTEFVKWILSFCPNIHTLKLQIIEEPKDLHNEIVHLKKLKDLHIGTSNGIDPKEVASVAFRTKTTLLTSSKLIRNCRQVEILRVESFCITLRDLAEFEHYNNLKEADLHWLHGPSVKEALPILERCTNLRRLSLTRWTKLFFPPANEMCDFIMKLKHLTYLYIQYCDNRQCDHFKSVRDKVNEFVLHRRPNLKFYLSCCYNFANSS
jgi:hypothetical protein